MTRQRWELDRVRLVMQAIIAVVVLGGATYLAAAKLIDSGAIIALYGAALGALGGGAVGGGRQAPQERITQHYTNGGTLTTDRPARPEEKSSG